MSFDALGFWVVKNNVVNGDPVFDIDFAEIEEMYADGKESGAFDEYESMAYEIWQAMTENQ